MTKRLLVSLALAASLLSTTASAEKVMLRCTAPEASLEYEAEIALSGNLRVAPCAEVAHPYVGEARIRARATARLRLEFEGGAADCAPVTFVVRSAEAFVEAFDSRLDVKLTSDEKGAAATVSVNNVQLSSERLDGAPCWRPPSGQASDADASAEASRVLQTILWNALVALGRLPDAPVSAGEEWTQTLAFPSTTSGANVPALIAGTITHRLTAIDQNAGSATVEFAGALSPVAGRPAFGMSLTVPAGAAPLALTVELEDAAGEVSGSMALPLQGGLPLAASGVVDGKLRVRLRSDDPDWQGRAVAVELEGRLNYAVRRSGE